MHSCTLDLMYQSRQKNQTPRGKSFDLYFCNAKTLEYHSSLQASFATNTKLKLGCHDNKLDFSSYNHPLTILQ